MIRYIVFFIGMMDWYKGRNMKAGALCLMMITRNIG
jgi:hypothetical protein